MREVGVFGGMASVIGLLLRPFSIVLRPSRKENVIGNARPTGNMAQISPFILGHPSDRALHHNHGITTARHSSKSPTSL